MKAPIVPIPPENPIYIEDYSEKIIKQTRYIHPDCYDDILDNEDEPLDVENKEWDYDIEIPLEELVKELPVGTSLKDLILIISRDRMTPEIYVKWGYRTQINKEAEIAKYQQEYREYQEELIKYREELKLYEESKRNEEIKKLEEKLKFLKGQL